MTKELKKLRIDFNLSQLDVASFLGLKNVSSYSRKENGLVEFSQSEIRKLIKLFNLTPEKVVEIFLS